MDYKGNAAQWIPDRSNRAGKVGDERVWLFCLFDPRDDEWAEIPQRDEEA